MELFFMVKMASGIDHGRRALNNDDDDDVAQHGGHPANTKSCSLGLHHISLILDIHIMFNWQLSDQEIRWPVSRDHIAGSGLELIKVTGLFWSGPLTKGWFSIGSLAHVKLTCWKQGKIVGKLVNTNPDLKVNQIITSSPMQMFFAALSCVYGDH